MTVAAILLPVMMAVSAFALDLGTLYAQRRALQNAADAAALAGARALQDQQLGETADPVGRARTYAGLNGVSTSGTACTADNKATVVVNQRGTTTAPTWEVTTSRLVPLTFGAFIGRSTQCVQANAQATASSTMMDIMLSLDTTGSMTLSGTDDFDQLRKAVVNVINQVDPDPNDSTTSKLGIARFAGIKCVVNGQGRYVEPCDDDKTLLSPLTTNKTNLLRIANAAPGDPCPLPASTKAYGCPLNHVEYRAPGASFLWPMYTGTKLPNAFTVLDNASYYAWSTANGGRDNAHKIMILITDGQNEESPAGNFPQDIAAYDTSMQTLADNIKRGKLTTDASDDVEVFVVGFFCAPYNTTNQAPDKFCKSRLVNSAEEDRACPGAWPPSGITASDIDIKLRNLSSSTAGTCDHYYPIRKSEDLPKLMKKLSQRFAGVRLTG